MKISIIIPVHNAAKYLARCLDSVVVALTEISSGEIIAVEDHSTDDSMEILAEYQKKYPRLICTLQCDTRGASAARNLGARKAKGDYIWFVDADDYIRKDAVKKLIAKATDAGADMVMMGAKRMLTDGASSLLTAVDANDPNFKSRFVRYGMGPWQILIRLKWWLEYNFKFREGFIHEDMELMSSLILYTDKFASVGDALYYYCNNPDSVLHKKKFSRHIFDIFPALEGLYRRFEVAGATREYHDELEWFFIWNLLIDSAKDFGQFPEGKPGFRRSREMLTKYYPNWRKNRFLKQKPLRLRIRVRLNYHK